MMAPSADLAVFGGSGLYDIGQLEDVEKLSIETPFGVPSDRIVLGRLEGINVAFLARHGEGHRLMPTEINYRANVFAMKMLGARWVLSCSAVGSLQPQYEPLHVVIPNQFIDRTRHRVDTFFGDGVIVHVSLADPFSEELSKLAARAAREAEAGHPVRVHEGGTYVCMEGPQFSSRAESNMYRQLGGDVIGMTNLTEARLCREAEMSYASLCFVTDYDCWKTDEDHVTVEQVIDRLHKNADVARSAVVKLAYMLAGPEGRFADPAHTALDSAILTPRDRIADRHVEKLRPLIGRALKLDS